MSAAGFCGAGVDRGRRDTGAAGRTAAWLTLAAAPTFALMAVLTGVFGGVPMAMLCSIAPGIPIDGMALMYVLMSAFHLAPWLRRISGERGDDSRS